MKFRTDFVTNSSSSSFVAMLEIKLDNGKTIKASREESIGEGDMICHPRTKYLCRSYEDLGAMKDKYVFESGNCSKIVSGTMNLMCHTYGEESYRADPVYLLGNHLGYEWKKLLDEGSKKRDEAELLVYLRGQSLLQNYTDESLHELAKCILPNDLDGNDTRIIQTLNDDGTISLSIKRGNDLFNTSDSLRHVPDPTEYIELFSSYANTKKKAKEEQKVQEAAERALEEERLEQEVRDRSTIIMDAIKSASSGDVSNTCLTLKGKVFAFAKNSSFEDNYRVIDCLNSLGLQRYNDQIDYNALKTIFVQRGASLTCYATAHDYLVCEDPSLINTESSFDNKPGESGCISFQELWDALATAAVLSTDESEQMQKSIKITEHKRFWKNDAKEDAAFVKSAKSLLNRKEFLSKTVYVEETKTTMRAYLEKAPSIPIKGCVFGLGYPDFDFLRLMGSKGDCLYLVIARRGGDFCHGGASKIRQSCIDYDIDYSTDYVPEYGKNIISAFVLLKTIINTPELNWEDYIEYKGILEKRVEAKKEEQRAQARQREAEKQQRAEEARKLREETRRQRDEEKQEKERQKEERRHLREEKNELLAAEAARKKQEKQQQYILQQEEKARLAVEAKAQKERDRQDAIANANILYAPGQEPENIRRRIQTLFEKLDTAYPDRKISGLYNDHKKWAETVTDLRRILGYVDNASLLEAYGYTILVNDNKGGRPVTFNPNEIIAELKRRYPNGAGQVSLQTLKDNNPDIPWKNLQNNASACFGQSLVAYLKTIGIID